MGGVTDGDFPEAMEMEKLSKDSQKTSSRTIFCLLPWG